MSLSTKEKIVHTIKSMFQRKNNFIFKQKIHTQRNRITMENKRYKRTCAEDLLLRAGSDKQAERPM